MRPFTADPLPQPYLLTTFLEPSRRYTVLLHCTLIDLIQYLEGLLFHLSAWNASVYIISTFKLQGFFV